MPYDHHETSEIGHVEGMSDAVGTESTPYLPEDIPVVDFEVGENTSSDDAPVIPIEITEEMRNRWIEQFDPKSRSPYYYNTETGECAWEKPVDYFGGGTYAKADAALNIQNQVRKKQAKKTVTKKREEVSKKE